MLRIRCLLVSVLPHAAQMRPDSDPRQHAPERLPNKLKRSQNMQMIVDIAIHYGYLPYGPISYLPFLNSLSILFRYTKGMMLPWRIVMSNPCGQSLRSHISGTLGGTEMQIAVAEGKDFLQFTKEFRNLLKVAKDLGSSISNGQVVVTYLKALLGTPLERKVLSLLDDPPRENFQIPSTKRLQS
jgi:hypothetical protein